MKFTTSEFKKMLKETLTDLINEGVFDKKFESIVETKIKGMNLESNSTGAKPSLQKEAIIKELKNKVMQDFAGNPYMNVLTEISQELPDKMINEKNAEAGLGTPQQIIKDEQELKMLSGGNMQRWAQAAFSGRKKQ